MKARVGDKPRPQGLERRQQPLGIVAATQPRLPRPCRSMEHSGHAVGDRLAVAVDERDIDRKVDARARHHLPFERVAVQIDDTRQNQKGARVEFNRAAFLVRTDAADFAVSDRQRGFQNFSVKQRAAAFDENIGHLWALRRGGGEWVAASYFSRNASIASFLKSVSAARSAWWCQSHHAKRTRRSAISSVKRRLIGRAGLPPTML